MQLPAKVPLTIISGHILLLLLFIRVPSSAGAFYISFGLLGVPLFERIFAATRASGTCTFLVFASDFCGYLVTIFLLLYKDFGPISGSTDADLLKLFKDAIFWSVFPFSLLLTFAALFFHSKIRSNEYL